MNDRLKGINQIVYINYWNHTVGKMTIKDNKLKIEYWPGFLKWVEIRGIELLVPPGTYDRIPLEIKVRMKEPSCYMMKEFIRKNNITYDNEFELLGKQGGLQIGSVYDFSLKDFTRHDRYEWVVKEYLENGGTLI